MMTGSVANVLKIIVFAASSDTTLRRSRTVIWTRFFACKDVFKLHHPCVSKQKRWVVSWNERTRRHDGVAIFMKMFKEL